MGRAAQLIILSLLLINRPANAEWRATLHRFGYFGELSLGAVYQRSLHHEFDLSVGFYSQDSRRIGQINLAYRYSHWQLEDTSFSWKPLQAGLFLISSLDRNRYFLKSPGKYPESQYYDQTALRLGFELGSQIEFRDLHLSAAYFVRFLDSSLIALYNNDLHHLEYFVSSGIALSYRF